MTKETESSEFSKKYRLGNKNRKREFKSIVQTLEKTDLDTAQKEYLEFRFMEALFSLDRLAIENKVLFQSLRVAVMISGILIIAVVNLFKFEHLVLIVTILSALSSICFGVLQLFRQDTMWAHHRLKFEEIRKELYLFLHLSGEIYKDSKSHADSFQTFIDRAEYMFDKEITDYFSSLQIGANVVAVLKLK